MHHKSDGDARGRDFKTHSTKMWYITLKRTKYGLDVSNVLQIPYNPFLQKKLHLCVFQQACLVYREKFWTF